MLQFINIYYIDILGILISEGTYIFCLLPLFSFVILEHLRLDEGDGFNTALICSIFFIN